MGWVKIQKVTALPDLCLCTYNIPTIHNGMVIGGTQPTHLSLFLGSLYVYFNRSSYVWISFVDKGAWHYIHNRMFIGGIIWLDFRSTHSSGSLSLGRPIVCSFRSSIYRAFMLPHCNFSHISSPTLKSHCNPCSSTSKNLKSLGKLSIANKSQRYGHFPYLN